MKPRHLINLIPLIISLASFGQNVSYSQWNTEAQSDIRLLPEYGHLPKTRGQRKADEQLIKDYVAQEGTRRKASEALIGLGFNYLYSRNPKAAMSRFNQAWLLDSTNENVHWGFGAVYFSFYDSEKALIQYDIGLKMNPKNTNMLTDKATIYTSMYDQSKKEEYLKEALGLFAQSYDIDSTNQNTLFKLSACHFRNHDCDNAWKYYNECKALGGKPITQAYTDALEKECKK